MKSLTVTLKKLEKNIMADLISAQRKTANQICKDAQSLAPGSGEYSKSIKVGNTQINGNRITTQIYTGLTVNAKSTGNSYNLGFLLETGTNPHAIPNAFNWGVIYGYDSPMYKRTLEPDWHPGFPAMPHFIPALNKNKKVYIDNISSVLAKRGVK